MTTKHIRNNTRTIENLIIHHINRERQKRKLQKLKTDGGLRYLSRRHSRNMAKRGKLWHGKNVFIAEKFVHIKKTHLQKLLEMYVFIAIIIPIAMGVIYNLHFFIFILLLFILLVPSFILAKFEIFYKGISGENCAMMVKGNVKGFKRPIKTDKDIAWAIHKILMNSPGHRENILTDGFKKIGVGVWKRRNRFFATELFFG